MLQSACMHRLDGGCWLDWCCLGCCLFGLVDPERLMVCLWTIFGLPSLVGLKPQVGRQPRRGTMVHCKSDFGIAHASSVGEELMELIAR